MRRIPYIPLLATLLLTYVAAPSFVVADSALAAATPTINKAELNKAVQEALAKRSGTATGGQAAAGAGGAVGAAGAASASEGLGSSGALSNLTNGGGEEATPTTSTPSTSSASKGISTGVLVPIFIVGVALLGGIAFFIVRDARSVAPVGDGLAGGGSAQDRAARLRKRRAKAKAARRQRKRNR
ncbi:MAG TPA: hypothetical protein VNX67_06435 [Solirubrobacteraceae bacterium]|jgi:hypothetical protein|nr:hypothetical protein [Solirubrobacteraceae bacterium]